MLWWTREHIAATSSSFSRNQQFRFYLSDTIRTFSLEADMWNSLPITKAYLGWTIIIASHLWMHSISTVQVKSETAALWLVSCFARAGHICNFSFVKVLSLFRWFELLFINQFQQIWYQNEEDIHLLLQWRHWFKSFVLIVAKFARPLLYSPQDNYKVITIKSL